ncbi:MAG: RNase J family beta-CASP ribonuclease, partial [Bifidobacteriaceae bacterium]|nr:RNase J family beta-CASP ribonuclease [Bifidobacteriaceae bacterium]
YTFNIVRPRGVMPVHGEARHLVASGALAVATGVAPERVVLAENGLVVDLAAGEAQIVGAVPVGQVYVDGTSVGELTEEELKDRRILGDEGFVSVFAVVNSRKRKIVAAPSIQARGMAEPDEVFSEILPGLTNALQDAMDSGAVDAHQLQQVMRRTLGRWVGGKLRKRPLIIPVIVEV